MGVLLEPWQDPATRRALLDLVLLGVAAGALGCWVVLTGLAYGAESLAHALLPGLVLAVLAGIPLLLGAAGGLVVAAAAMALAGRAPAIGRDTATAVVVTTCLGAGALLALAPGTPTGLGSLLFGDVLAVGDGDLALAAGLAVTVCVVLWRLHHSLLVAGFDRLNAAALGRRPAVADLLLALLLAATLLVAVGQLGNLLVVGLLVAPAVAARALTNRLAPMMAVGAAVAALAAFAGLTASFHLQTAAGASVAAALVLGAALAALVSSSRRSGRAA